MSYADNSYEGNCGTCFFIRNIDSRTKMGECHRKPPQVILSSGSIHATQDTVFPKVKVTEWCGCGILADVSQSKEK